MEDNDFYKRADIAAAKAMEAALKAALAHVADTFDYAKYDIPNRFGAKWQRRIARVRQSLTEEYGNQFASLIALAQRSYVYSIVRASSYMRSLYEDVGGVRNEEDRSITTPNAYADYEGWACALANGCVRSPKIDQPKDLMRV